MQFIVTDSDGQHGASGHVSTGTDTCVGLDEKEISITLTAFGQIKIHVAHLSDGTRLGLSLAKRLVDLQRGVFNISSEKGAGTLDRLSHNLDVPFCDFFDDGREFETASHPKIDLEMEIRGLIRSLPDDDLEMAVGQIELLAKHRQS